MLSATPPKPSAGSRLRPSPLEQRDRSRISSPPLFVSGLPGDVEDVSEGGMCMRLREPLPVGSRHELILTDGLVNFTREVRAEVRWARGGRVGLSWVEPDPAIRNWFMARFSQWPGRTRLLPRRRRRGYPAIPELSQRVRVRHRPGIGSKRVRMRTVRMDRW